MCPPFFRCILVCGVDMMVTSKLILDICEGDLETVNEICRMAGLHDDIFDDSLKDSYIHVLTYVDKTPVATGRLFVTEDRFTIGRVAVLPQFRGNAIGDLTVRQLIRAAHDRGGKQQFVHALLSAQGFYEKLGFTVVKCERSELPQGGLCPTERNVIKDLNLKCKFCEKHHTPYVTMVHDGDVNRKCK